MNTPHKQIISDKKTFSLMPEIIHGETPTLKTT